MNGTTLHWKTPRSDKGNNPSRRQTSKIPNLGVYFWNVSFIQPAIHGNVKSQTNQFEFSMISIFAGSRYLFLSLECVMVIY